jgi:hypothetical protein
MADGTVEDIRTKVEGRLKELEPYVEEYRRLQRVADAIRDADTPSPAPRARSRRGAPRRALRESGPGRAGHSARSDQAQKMIAKQPGITVAELSAAMGIGTTYLYRLLPQMERDGKLRKEGKGYFPA